MRIKSDRQILNLIGFGTAISLLGDATLYTVLPEPTIAAQVGVSLTMVGILLGANRAVRLLLNSPVGILVDRLPRRPLLILSLGMGAIANLSYALGQGFWPILIGRILWGIAWSILWIVGNAAILDISDNKNRGRIRGRYQMWFYIGVAFSAFLGGLLTDLFGFRATMWLTCALLGASTLLWFFLMPETKIAYPSTSENDEPKQITTPTPWKFIVSIAFPVFISRFISMGILAATTILWLSRFIGDGLQIANAYIPLATLTGAFTAFTMLANITSAPLAGHLSDRINRRWLILGGSALIGAIGLGLMSSTWFPAALIGALLAQVTGGSTEALIPTIAGDHIEETARGRALGIVYTFGDLGSTLGPPAALGLLSSGILTIPLIYQFSAILLLGVALFSSTQKKSSTY